MTTIVGISGSLTNPSRTTVLVETILAHAARSHGARTSLVNIADLASDLGNALNPKALPQKVAVAHAALFSADALIIASPVYKASYTGLLKHFFDLIDPKELRGKSVLLAATGGGDSHALSIEHQLRPLAAFFGLYTTPVGIYLKDGDFAKIDDGRGYRLENPEALKLIDAGVAQLVRLASVNQQPLAVAA